MKTVLKFVMSVKEISLKELSLIFNIKPQSINQWINGKRNISKKHCSEIEALTGYDIGFLQLELNEERKIIVLENELKLLKEEEN